MSREKASGIGVFRSAAYSAMGIFGAIHHIFGGTEEVALKQSTTKVHWF